MDNAEELQGQIYDMAGEMYEDQFALIVIGEAEPCDETSVEVHAAGAAIIPDCCTPDMLTTAIVELMRKANDPGLSFENMISLPESDASIRTGYGRPMSLGRSPYEEVAAWIM